MTDEREQRPSNATSVDWPTILRERAQELREQANLTAASEGAHRALKTAEELGRLANLHGRATGSGSTVESLQAKLRDAEHAVRRRDEELDAIHRALRDMTHASAPDECSALDLVTLVRASLNKSVSWSEAREHIATTLEHGYSGCPNACFATAAEEVRKMAGPCAPAARCSYCNEPDDGTHDCAGRPCASAAHVHIPGSPVGCGECDELRTSDDQTTKGKPDEQAVRGGGCDDEQDRGPLSDADGSASLGRREAGRAVGGAREPSAVAGRGGLIPGEVPPGPTPIDLPLRKVVPLDVTLPGVEALAFELLGALEWEHIEQPHKGSNLVRAAFAKLLDRFGQGRRSEAAKPGRWEALYRSASTQLAALAGLLDNENGDPEVSLGMVRDLLDRTKGPHDREDCPCGHPHGEQGSCAGCNCADDDGVLGPAEAQPDWRSLCNQLGCDPKNGNLRCLLPKGHAGPGDAWAPRRERDQKTSTGGESQKPVETGDVEAAEHGVIAAPVRSTLADRDPASASFGTDPNASEAGSCPGGVFPSQCKEPTEFRLVGVGIEAKFCTTCNVRFQTRAVESADSSCKALDWPARFRLLADRLEGRACAPSLDGYDLVDGLRAAANLMTGSDGSFVHVDGAVDLPAGDAPRVMLREYAETPFTRPAQEKKP